MVGGERGWGGFILSFRVRGLGHYASMDTDIDLMIK
jgi:hypothetical protein